MNYRDIVIVENFDEAQQFRYSCNDEPVEVCTPVGYNQYIDLGEKPSVDLICFDGIYFQDCE